MPKELTSPYKPWFVYLIECQNYSIYTGITVDVEKRYAAHASGKGARYTRIHPPIKLLAVVEFNDRAAAASTEYTIKQWTAEQKRAFAALHAVVNLD
ncbi:GIY-YIG nuclease family protein [Iodobacter ciconiae]|uniref:GIY-YIG nuclease family protein n=1 Tax=Iodobacter ciconiae TaxID=2496266 RepID=A0A3S8ZQP7_9NEIS|nr:GIY-YIG nuclease family protein [Iodobacter ciconiae]AZN35806.1 GIY-YIG nuclease family protein [Iodobacter ciconiae]